MCAFTKEPRIENRRHFIQSRFSCCYLSIKDGVSLVIPLPGTLRNVLGQYHYEQAEQFNIHHHHHDHPIALSLMKGNSLLPPYLLWHPE